MSSGDPYPIRLIRMATYDVRIQVNVNVGRVEMSGSLPDDPATWTAADLRFALESGLATVQHVYHAAKEDA